MSGEPDVGSMARTHDETTDPSMEDQLEAVAAATEDLWGRLWEADADKVRAFPLQDGDLAISGYPKSGTNWMQVIVKNLWSDWGGLLDGAKVPNMASQDRDGYGGFETSIKGPSPRLMKLHLDRFEMPQRWPEHGKVIHVTRNPKDVCVSFFHNIQVLPQIDEVLIPMVGPKDMDFHVRRFVRGAMPWGPYTENVISWRTFDHPNLLKITYEDARQDIRGTIDQIVAFLGRPVEAACVEEVIEKTEFSAMMQGDLRAEINVPTNSDGSFMRKGVVGDWKQELNDEQSRLIDTHVVRPLEEHGINLTYE